MKCRTAAARRRRQRWGVVFQDRIGGVNGPPVILDGLQFYRTFLAASKAVQPFCVAADLPFNLVLMQPRGRPTVDVALAILQDDHEYRSEFCSLARGRIDDPRKGGDDDESCFT